jgi:hypothetical protein
MLTLDWLNRDGAFRIAKRVPTRVLRPHPSGGPFGDAVGSNLLIQGDNLDALKALRPHDQEQAVPLDQPSCRERHA